MLPASEYSLARWKKTSTSWSSSRIATLISWRFAAITNSLLMNAPTIHGENRSSKKREGNQRLSEARVIHRTVCPARTDSKSFSLTRRRTKSRTPCSPEAAHAALHESEKTRSNGEPSAPASSQRRPTQPLVLDQKNPDADQK